MGELNARIKILEAEIEKLKSQIVSMLYNTEEDRIKPYSKIGNISRFENMDLIYDGINDLYHTYAIFKDDEEEE